jgi:hypothetical protein
MFACLSQTVRNLMTSTQLFLVVYLRRHQLLFGLVLLTNADSQRAAAQAPQ